MINRSSVCTRNTHAMGTRDVKWVVVPIALVAAKTQSVQTKQVPPHCCLGTDPSVLRIFD